MIIKCCQQPIVNKKIQCRESLKAKVNSIRSYEKQKQAELVQAQLEFKTSLQNYEKQKQADLMQTQMEIKKAILEDIEFIKGLFH